MKDSQPLTIDGSVYHLTQTITDRASSTYSNVLTVSKAALSGVAGTYNCTVTNDLGSDSSEVVVVGKDILTVYNVTSIHACFRNRHYNFWSG